MANRGKKHETSSSTEGPAAEVGRFLERDLTAEARSGRLQPAFEVDETLDRISEILISGKNPVLVGESGVGKTAILHELVRRAALGVTYAEILQGRRVLQMSLA